MSFILDAIAKSEQERQQQEAPGVRVLTLPVDSVPQTRRTLYYVVAAALFLNAVVLMTWMWPEQDLRDESSPSPPKSVKQLNEPVIAPDNTGTAEAIVETDNKAAIDKMLAGLPKAIPTTNKTSTSLKSLPEEDRSGPEVVAISGDAESTNRIETERVPQKPDSGESVVNLENGQNNAPIARPISSLRELPSSVRKNLPKVVFSGHLYSSNPNSRIVFVDGGRPVTKGQEIADDLFLYEITPSGVIVEFRGYLIDVGVLDNWTLD